MSQEKQSYTIKTAYKYFDESTKLWNLFTFIEFCTINFCIQSIRKDYTVLTEPKIFDEDYNTNERILMKYYMFDCCDKGFDIIYTFESNNDINKSIYDLKQHFKNKLKKQHITKTLYKSTDCFNCLCCNWFVYVLEKSYEINKQNIIDNGIYAKQVIEFGANKVLEKLEDAICEEPFIVKKDNKLVDMINKFINSKYNINVFYDVNHREYSDHIPNYVYCDIKGCEYNAPTILEGQKMYYCYDCYKSEYIRDNKYNYDEIYDHCYNLCPTHFTQENINNHKEGTHKFGLWSKELEDFDDYYRLKRCSD